MSNSKSTHLFPSTKVTPDQFIPVENYLKKNELDFGLGIWESIVLNAEKLKGWNLPFFEQLILQNSQSQKFSQNHKDNFSPNED